MSANHRRSKIKIEPACMHTWACDVRVENCKQRYFRNQSRFFVFLQHRTHLLPDSLQSDHLTTPKPLDGVDVHRSTGDQLS